MKIPQLDIGPLSWFSDAERPHHSAGAGSKHATRGDGTSGYFASTQRTPAQPSAVEPGWSVNPIVGKFPIANPARRAISPGARRARSSQVGSRAVASPGMGTPAKLREPRSPATGSTPLSSSGKDSGKAAGSGAEWLSKRFTSPGKHKCCTTVVGAATPTYAPHTPTFGFGSRAHNVCVSPSPSACARRKMNQLPSTPSTPAAFPNVCTPVDQKSSEHTPRLSHGQQTGPSLTPQAHKRYAFDNIITEFRTPRPASKNAAGKRAATAPGKKASAPLQTTAGVPHTPQQQQQQHGQAPGKATHRSSSPQLADAPGPAGPRKLQAGPVARRPRQQDAPKDLASPAFAAPSAGASPANLNACVRDSAKKPQPQQQQTPSHKATDAAATYTATLLRALSWTAKAEKYGTLRQREPAGTGKSSDVQAASASPKPGKRNAHTGSHDRPASSRAGRAADDAHFASFAGLVASPLGSSGKRVFKASGAADALDVSSFASNDTADEKWATAKSTAACVPVAAASTATATSSLGGACCSMASVPSWKSSASESQADKSSVGRKLSDASLASEGSSGAVPSHISNLVCTWSSSGNENQNDYSVGGYLKLQRGTKLGPNDRYHVITKLGWGEFSTVWLCWDSETLGNRSRTGTKQFVALKVSKCSPGVLKTTKDEVSLLKFIDKAVRSKRTRVASDYAEPEALTTILDSFEHQGPYGSHIVMVFPVLGQNILCLVEQGHRHKVAVANKTSKGLRTAQDIEFVKETLRCILTGLSALDDVNVIHTDLKPENILLASVSLKIRKEMRAYQDELMSKGLAAFDSTTVVPTTEMYSEEAGCHGGRAAPVKVSDFGLSLLLEPEDRKLGANASKVVVNNPGLAQNPLGVTMQTREYRAPEILFGSQFTAASDIWSVGCIAHELITGDFLMDPKKSANKAQPKPEDEINIDHACMYQQLLGEFAFDLDGKHKRKYFHRDGRFRFRSKVQKQFPKRDLEAELRAFLPAPEASKLASFVLFCLKSPNVLERPTASDCLKHPFLAKPDAHAHLRRI
ncbi:Serine/threonine-protein kinase SRPK [Diplonema papillatum]|nr:Serine/threonine-protein kinase SRPK [Diplonema papillatum]